jgi:prepilin-type N-terminal cleavage/methylation domain-containing protein
MRSTERAFTLLELMVVVAIVGILTTLGYPSLNQALRHRALDIAAHGAATAINQARYFAMTQRKYVTVYPWYQSFYVQADGTSQNLFRYPINPSDQIDSSIQLSTTDWVKFSPTALLVDNNKVKKSSVSVMLKDTVTGETITVTVNIVGAIEFIRS